MLHTFDYKSFMNCLSFRSARVATLNVQHWPKRAWRRCSMRPSSPSWLLRRRKELWREDWDLAASTAVWSRDAWTTKITQQPTVNQTWTVDKRKMHKREDWKGQNKSHLMLQCSWKTVNLSLSLSGCPWRVEDAVYYQRSTKSKSVSSSKRLSASKVPSFVTIFNHVFCAKLL